MKHFRHHLRKIQKDPNTRILLIVGVIILGLFTYSYFRIFSMSEQIATLRAELDSTTALFDSKTNELASNITDLDEETAGISDTLTQNIVDTKKNIETVATRVGGFEATVGQISGTVDTLEKLSKTDPELLQKYSKVYFLNEHYVPERLLLITKEDLYIEAVPEQIGASVSPYLNSLLSAAKSSDLKLYVKSAYRSFTEQESLKSAYTVTYGAGTANQFSADQGYSEHQLGTTVDFITTGLGGRLSGFENTATYKWLLENAYQFGFTLSYPEGNSYYVFEPWHWRFVGIDLATYLYNENKNFYDLDQREIDEYLVSFLD